MEEKGIPQTPYFETSVAGYLQNGNAIGMKFRLPDTTASAVNMYIQSGVFSDIRIGGNGLHTECRIPEKELYNLLLAQVDNPCEYIDEAVQKDKDYKAGINALMREYPELKDAQLSLDTETLFNNLFIGGRPAHQAVTYMLHFPNWTTSMLGDMLAVDIRLSDETWAQEMRPDMQKFQKELKLPPNMRCKFGAERFYFFEKGKTGFATVHPDRSVRWFGEKLSGLAQGIINRVATRDNIIYLDRQFFRNRALGRINMPMADTQTGKFRNIYIQSYDDGTDVFMEKAVPLKDGITSNLISMKGRFTQVQFTERSDGHYMRCRMDGEMQMYKQVRPDDYTAFQNGALNAELLAAKYFVSDFLSMQQERNQGIKR